MARMSTGKFLGLVLGCIVVAVMLFMMFAVLGGLFSPEQ
jgi:ABC-type transport system involved in multi-copper enzyme maturation permease subunit